MGRALSQWEQLEQRLANLFLVVCECSGASNNPVRRAYGAVENGTLRRAALLEAAKVCFGSSWRKKLVQKSFNELLQAVSRASKRRDDIAHGMVHFHSSVIDPDGKPTKNYGGFLFPPYYNTARTKASFVLVPGEEVMPPDFHLSDFRLTSGDILEWEKRFGQLKRVIADWENLMAKRDGKIPFVEAVTGVSS